MYIIALISRKKSIHARIILPMEVQIRLLKFPYHSVNQPVQATNETWLLQQSITRHYVPSPGSQNHVFGRVYLLRQRRHRFVRSNDSNTLAQLPKRKQRIIKLSKIKELPTAQPLQGNQEQIQRMFNLMPTHVVALENYFARLQQNTFSAESLDS